MAEPRKILSDAEFQMLQKFSKDPVLAAESLLIFHGKPLRLDPYQRIVLRSLWEGKPNNLLLMGRGMAKTFILAIFALLKLLFLPNQKIVIISSSYRQARNLFSVIKEFWHESPYVKQAIEKEPSNGTNECVAEVRTEKGLSFIKALPIGDGTTIRGARANVLLLDEYAQIPKDIITMVINPMMSVKAEYGTNQKVIATTAYYQFNHLYDTYRTYIREIEKDNKDYNLQSFTYKDTPNHIDIGQIERDKLEMPLDQFLMEYENIFPSDGDGFFPPSLVRGSQTKNCNLERVGTRGSQYVLGVDPATESDNFALVVIKVSGSANKVVKVETISRGSYPQLAECIRWHCENFNVVRICMDQGGGGLALRDILSEDAFYIDSNGNQIEREPILLRDLKDPKSYPNRIGKRILDLIYFSGKEINYMNVSLKADLENGNLVLPIRPVNGNSEQESMYDQIEKMINEITMIKTTVNSTNYLSFDTSNKKTKKDRYSALILANKAAREVRGGDGKEQPTKLATGFWGRRYF